MGESEPCGERERRGEKVVPLSRAGCGMKDSGTEGKGEERTLVIGRTPSRSDGPGRDRRVMGVSSDVTSRGSAAVHGRMPGISGRWAEEGRTGKVSHVRRTPVVI